MTIGTLEQRRKNLGLSNKSLAVRLTELLPKTSGKSYSLETIEPRVSRLFARNSDGVTFFRKHPRELAAALDLPEERVHSALTVPILLLDPAIPTDVVAVLVERQQSLGTFEALRVEDVLEEAPSAARDALREAAKRATAACTVLETSLDDGFYEGAGLQRARYERTKRGVRILSMPDLLPDPPLKPPRRREGRHVLVPDPELAASANELRASPRATMMYGQSPRWSESDSVYWLERAEATGEEPSFPLAQAIPGLSRRIGDPDLRMREESGNRISLSDLRGTNPTVIWQAYGRFLLTGRAARALEEAIGDSEIRSPGSEIARFLEEIERRNPFREQALAEITALLADNQMLDEKSLLSEWRSELIGRDEGPHVLAPDPSAETAARELLSTIAQREWRDLHAPLRLRAAARAELMLLAPAGRRDAVHVIANMGAGRLLKIRVLRFENEAVPFAPFEAKRDSWRHEPAGFDGGDVHLMMKALYDEMLEGERLVPRERRREAAARAAADD